MELAGQARPAYFLYRCFWELMDWVFPPTCGGCAATGNRWCNTCQANVAELGDKICPLCGEPQPAHDICQNCKQDPPIYRGLRSYALFQGPLRKALHRLKYDRDIGLGEALSKHLIEIYNLNNWQVDYVVPVPLSPTRLRERGYNQAYFLGRPLAYAIQKPLQSDMLIKNRETRTQVGLSALERRLNVDGAFSSRSNLVRYKTILVIDDVTTTGSTISACAKALLEAGASAVYGLTLARAVLQADADDRPNPSQ